MGYGNRGTAQRNGGQRAPWRPANMPDPVRMPYIETAQNSAILNCIANETCNVVVEADAGTGKTSLAVESMYRLPSGLSVRFLAFGADIARTLKARVPRGVNAGTFHSLGGGVVLKHLEMDWGSFDRIKDTDKTKNWLLPRSMPGVSDSQSSIMRDSIQKLVDQCKNQMIDGRDPEVLLNLAAEYDIDLGDWPGSVEEIIGWVPGTLVKAREHLDHIDFTDMLWLPKVLNLALPRADFLIVDEVQDLNPIRQWMALQCGHRIAIVGDRKQAIMGFTGADTRSMDTMTDLLRHHNGRGVSVFPLTETYRCPKVVVALARKHAPNFTALPSAPDGTLCYGDSWGILDAQAAGGIRIVPKTDDELRVVEMPVPGHMVVNRTNAPLVTLAYWFIRQNIPVQILGRDIGSGLTSLIKKLCGKDCEAVATGVLLSKLATYQMAQSANIRAANGTGMESKLQLLDDKVMCIKELCDGVEMVGEVMSRIRVLFEDPNPNEPIVKVRLASMHKSKGLEAGVVWMIHPELVPHPMAKSADAMEQERNLEYVAQTRSKGILHIHNLAGLAA